MFIIVFGSLPALNVLWERLFDFIGSTLASGERSSTGRHTGGSKVPMYHRQLSSSGTDGAIYRDEMTVPDVELHRLTDR